MEYNDFKIALTGEVANLVGEEVNVAVHQIEQNNGQVRDALTIMREGDNISPTMYMDEFFRDYESGMQVDALACRLVREHSQSGCPGHIDARQFTDFTCVRDKIVYKLVNYERNKQALKTIPYTRYMDLAKIYYFSVDEHVIGNATVTVHESNRKKWNVSVQELEQLASCNTPRLLQPQFLEMGQMMRDLLRDQGQDDIQIIDAPDQPVMYLLTNQKKYLGAACICYPNVLSDIAQKFDMDLYVLPSSIHETIIMPASGRFSQNELSDMVYEINRTQLREDEILADHAYLYRKKARILCV